VEWECILDELEDLDAIRAFDAAKAGSQETIPCWLTQSSKNQHKSGQD
jgi:hypothetical protein